MGIICEGWDDDDGMDVKHEHIWTCIHMTMLVHRRITTDDDDDDDDDDGRLGPNANANLLGFILVVGAVVRMQRINGEEERKGDDTCAREIDR